MSQHEQYSLDTAQTKKNTASTAYLAVLEHLKITAPEVFDCVVNELKAQRSHLKLIASENFSSLSVQLAQANLLTDKYSEGHPHHRFYAGCENVDKLESQAVELAKKVFQAEHAYVQPHSGADANLVAFWSILTTRVQSRELERLGKKNLMDLSDAEFENLRQILCSQSILGLSLSSGGHLTHGFRHNVSGKMFRAYHYDVNPQSERLDYDSIAKQAREIKPLILLVGYSAYTRLINFAAMREIADSVNAVLMVDMAHFAGLVAGKVFQGEYNPIPFAHVVTSTTHKTLRGPRGGLILCKKEFADEVNKGCPLVLGGPLPHVIAAKLVAFKEASTKDFEKYAHNVVANAASLGKSLMQRNINLVTGGTDNHILLINLTNLNLTGRQAETALQQAGLVANRNMIPFDPNGAWNTSGLRLGTPSLTTLGMGPDEMDEIADMIASVLRHSRPGLSQKTGQLSKTNVQVDQAILEETKQKVSLLLDRFPLYPEIPTL